MWDPYIKSEKEGHERQPQGRMTQFLPPNLLALFAPREPIPYLAPLDKLPHEKKPWPYTGVSEFLHEFEVCISRVLTYSLILWYTQDPADTPAPRKIETREERKARKVWV